MRDLCAPERAYQAAGARIAPAPKSRAGRRSVGSGLSLGWLAGWLARSFVRSSVRSFGRRQRQKGNQIRPAPDYDNSLFARGIAFSSTSIQLFFCYSISRRLFTSSSRPVCCQLTSVFLYFFFLLLALFFCFFPSFFCSDRARFCGELLFTARAPARPAPPPTTFNTARRSKRRRE